MLFLYESEFDALEFLDVLVFFAFGALVFVSVDGVVLAVVDGVVDCGGC